MKKLAAKLHECLMRDVYYPFSVCVELDEQGNICMLHQFDTAFCMPPKPSAAAREVWLMSNHPAGDMRPSPEDVRNIAYLRQSACTGVRLIIASEDNGWKEIK